MPRLSPAGPGVRGGPRVSVVIPARNEERTIEKAVRSHLGQDYPDLEVIVVEDRSSDATAAVLARLAAEDRRLTVVPGSEPPPDWLGKPHALFQGAARARGDLFLFADADVLYGPKALSESVALLERRGLDLLALFPKLEMAGFWENVLMPYLAESYFFGPAFLLNSDSQKWFAVGGGAGMLLRAGAYRAAGGHEELRNSVIDDMHLATRVRRSGGRCRMARADDRVRVRMYRGFRDVFDGFTKNLAYVFERLGGRPSRGMDRLHADRPDRSGGRASCRGGGSAGRVRRRPPGGGRLRVARAGARRPRGVPAISALGLPDPADHGGRLGGNGASLDGVASMAPRDPVARAPVPRLAGRFLTAAPAPA